MDIKDIRTVADLNNHFPEVSLVTTDYEVEHICQNINVDPEEYPTLFVLFGDTEYIAVWGCNTSVPWLNSRVNLLYHFRFPKQLKPFDIVAHIADLNRLGQVVENEKIATDGVLDLAIQWLDTREVQYFYTDQYIQLVHKVFPTI